MDIHPTYTLADLAGWSQPGVTLAVLGHPIRHSISPAMHTAALTSLAADNPLYADWRYVRFEVPPEDLPRALEQLHEKHFRGVNLTVPHKVLALSAPSVTSIDPGARPAGAINTLRWRTDGWEGFNTDGYGLREGLREDLGVELSRAHVVLLGAGGAARGAAVQCLQAGCASLSVGNRTLGNLESLLDLLRPLAGEGQTLRGFTPEAPPHDLPSDCIVVNATSAGLKTTDPLPIDPARLPRPQAVYDMIYNPAETRLLSAARALGLPAANGLSMLVHQGAKALEHWTGRAPPVEIMRKAAQGALGAA